MIHVDRAKVPCPPELSAVDSIGKLERQQAEEFFRDPLNHKMDFDFKAYAHDAVKEALTTLFHGKCAYCESRYAVTQPMDVEHYRPKGGVMVNKKLVKPGYYWLAAEWNNLLPSCIDCNRRRNQIIDGKRRKAGKENHFPLRSGCARATNPGEEDCEEPLLLNPCLDKPEEYLEFTDEGIVRPRLVGNVEDEKGRHSIDIYGLQRVWLVHERNEWATIIIAHMQRVRTCWEALMTNPDDKRLQDNFNREWKQFKGFASSKRRYAGMARQIINRFKMNLKEELE